MKTKVIQSLFVSLLISIGGASAAWADQVYSCLQADGSTELTSVSTGPQCELLSSGQPTQATEVSADTVPAAAEANADTPADKTAGKSAVTVTSKEKSESKEEVDPRQAYRDAMIQGAQHVEGAPAAALNPAISRRYLKVDRGAYRQGIGADPVQ
jgi:phage tail sheath gpL-like